MDQVPMGYSYIVNQLKLRKFFFVNFVKLWKNVDQKYYMSTNILLQQQKKKHVARKY